VALIPQYDRLLTTTKQQLTALQKPGVKELIELQRQLASEQELRTQITKKLQEAKDSVASGSPRTIVENIRKLADPASLSVGGSEFQAIVAGATAFEATVGTAESQLKVGLVAFEGIVGAQITSWKAKEGEAQKKVDEKRRELEALKVPFDMSYIAKLTKDEASHRQSVNNLNGWKPHLTELHKKRQKC